MSAPEKHPALFSDHGVVHVRDVAAGTLELADILVGGLLPARGGAAARARQRSHVTEGPIDQRFAVTVRTWLSYQLLLLQSGEPSPKDPDTGSDKPKPVMVDCNGPRRVALPRREGNP